MLSDHNESLTVIKGSLWPLKCCFCKQINPWKQQRTRSTITILLYSPLENWIFPTGGRQERLSELQNVLFFFFHVCIYHFGNLYKTAAFNMYKKRNLMPEQDSFTIHVNMFASGWKQKTVAQIQHLWRTQALPSNQTF